MSKKMFREHLSHWPIASWRVHALFGFESLEPLVHLTRRYTSDSAPSFYTCDLDMGCLDTMVWIHLDMSMEILLGKGPWHIRSVFSWYSWQIQ